MFVFRKVIAKAVLGFSANNNQIISVKLHRHFMMIIQMCGLTADAKVELDKFSLMVGDFHIKVRNIRRKCSWTVWSRK